VTIMTSTMTSSFPFRLPEPRPGIRRQPFDLSELPWADPPRIAVFEELLNDKFIHAVAVWMSQNGGPGPGPDGITWSELGPAEQQQICRDLAWQLRHQTFRPSAARLVRLAKLTGGYRELRMRDLPTRIVAKIAQLAIEPYFETLFSPNSFAYRQRLSPWHLLASLINAAENEGMLYIGQGDIRKAFDSLSPDLVLQDLHQHVNEDHMRWLITLILRKDNPFGVDQGCSFSPVALNAHLNAPDWTLSQLPGYMRASRFADNYFCIGRHASDVGASLYQADEELERKGLKLVTDWKATHLTHETFPMLLGFDVYSRNGSVTLSPSAKAWEHLRTSLHTTWQGNRPNDLASALASSWVEYFAPTENHQGTLIDSVCRELAQASFRSFSRNALQQVVTKAKQRWFRLRRGERVEGSATPSAVAITNTGEVVLTGAEYIYSASVEAPF
jgi:RNA-directed DNA polymerase